MRFNDLFYTKKIQIVIPLTKFVIFCFIVLPIAIFFIIRAIAFQSYAYSETTFWKFQSIDTMKYSRDVSREKLNDASFDEVIDMQVKNIAETGATHVSIATPYDEEFLPILKRWVRHARKYGLKVWFRGNWSGWEGWFGYPRIDRKTHIEKTRKLILKNKDLFEDGDVFTACPECENGGSGDPRRTGDVKGHRKFLIDEYEATKKAFNEIDRDILSNYNSMNGDVARVVMDKETTLALDGIVVIDHYVRDAQKLAFDIVDIAQNSGGKVVLGEFGVPIPDIHGKQTEEQQAIWIDETFKRLVEIESLEGINYWTSAGGSTQLWEENGRERKAVSVISKFYSPKQLKGIVLNEAHEKIEGAQVTMNRYVFVTGQDGSFSLPYLDEISEVEVVAVGYEKKVLSFSKPGADFFIVLKREKETLGFKLRKLLFRLFPRGNH